MKNKALFLDRDGVINVDLHYVYRSEDIIFEEGIFDLCYTAKKKGYLIIIITNQGGIGLGKYTEQDFALLMQWMKKCFASQQISIDDVFYCPFHPKAIIDEYRQDDHFDRKPNSGMLIKAIEKYNINTEESILIGDKESDITAAIGANVRTKILYHKNTEMPPKLLTQANHIVNDLRQVIKLL